MSDSVTEVACYSVRGGTGRTTGLANVAHALAERGASVGCMDLHLEAPDLHATFPNVGPAHNEKRTIHDYLQDDSDVRDIDNYIIDVTERLERTRHDPPSGEIALIAGSVEPPGSRDPKTTMERCLELREEFVEQRDLDYLLYDTAAGLSNHLIPVFDRADQFLVFYRWTNRHKRATKTVAEWLANKPVMGGTEMTSVANCVPEYVDGDEIEAWADEHLSSLGFTDHYLINRSDRLERDTVLATLEAPDSPEAEQYRELADKVEDEQQSDDHADEESSTEPMADEQSGGDIERNLDERNLEFAQSISELTEVLGNEYDDEWYDVVCDSVTNVGRALGANWTDKFRRRNEGRFIAFLTKLYSCPDRETYEAEVAIDDADAQYLLGPQRRIRDEVHEEWDDADFADAETRKSNVEQFVADLIDEPWGGEEPVVVVQNFKDRYNS